MSTTPTLENVIQKALEAVHANTDPSSEEYAAVVDQLAKLYKMKEIEQNCLIKVIEAETKKKEVDSRKFGMSPDVLAAVAANVFGIVAIIAHERVNVITTKALGFVMRASR